MIYINKHKEYHNPIPEDYAELYGGNLFKDTESDNINYLNPYINEATGLYYLWKNKNDEYIGLCHYKMFFKYNDDILSLKDAKEILKDHDIIIRHDMPFCITLYEQLKIMVENTPYLDKWLNEYYKKIPDFKDFLQRKSFNNSEMFVCKKELIDKYCEWLFPIVIPIAEKFVQTDKDKVFNTRLIGHILERLFAYWIWKNNLKTYRMDVLDV